MFLGSAGRLPARERRDQRYLRLRGRLRQNRRIRDRQHRRNWARRVGRRLFTTLRRSLMANCCACFSLWRTTQQQLNRQGPDEGTQYRSSIFYGNDEQKRIAESYIAQLDQAKIFSGPIVTKVVPLQAFYPAEAYHQNYADLASQPALHRFQRRSEGRAPAPAVSRSLHRKID